jgi:hypothetical protein
VADRDLAGTSSASGGPVNKAPAAGSLLLVNKQQKIDERSRSVGDPGLVPRGGDSGPRDLPRLVCKNFTYSPTIGKDKKALKFKWESRSFDYRSNFRPTVQAVSVQFV